MPHPDVTVFDRALDAAARAGRGVLTVLRERKNPGGSVQKMHRVLGRGTHVLSALFLLVLVGVLAALEWYGERHWLLSFCLYLPPTGWLLPLLVLTPLGVVFAPRALWPQAACAFLVLFVYMDFKWPHRPTSSAPTLTAVTNNIGENNKQSLTPFIEAEKPDLIALQDATGRGQPYAKAYPGFAVAEHGEFVLLSKFPIKSSGLVPHLNWKGAPIAAWFELDVHGRSLRVYNVHLPSPRSDLDLLRGFGFPVILLSPAESRFGKKRLGYQESWRARMQLERDFLAVLQQEKDPFLAVGDFNTPDHGYAYHLFARHLNDAAKLAGRGYGFTLPGTTRNPLSLFGPWLRIDYLFSSTDLTPVYCRTEPSRKSQHRAVAARFALPPTK